MNRASWVLLAGSVALAGAVAAMATREHSRSPEEDLRGIHDRLGRGKIDRDDALNDLDRLVERTLETGDPKFVAKLRISRGRLLMDIAAWDRAREDLQVALGLGVLSDVERAEAEDDLIGLHLRAGNYENALNLVKTLLDRDPRDASAWMRSGEIHRRKSEIPLESARELIASRLVADEAFQADAELDRLAAMDPIDPKRPAASHALAARFELGDEDRALRILRMADSAARENAQARIAFATSIAVKDPRADPGKALAALIELLDRAGRSSDAAEVGTCGLRMLRSRGDTTAIGLLVDVLDGLGRRGYACEVGKRLVSMPNPISPSRLLMLTRLFYANGRWGDLGIAAGKLMQVGTTAETQEAAYYAAMSQVHQEQHATGLYALQRFLATPATQPVEGARAEAWKMVALAARKLRLSDLEREALDTAIQLDRDGSGEEMLRLAAVLAQSAQGFRRPEMQVAQAMNIMPERTAELLPQWERYGKKELEETNRSITDVLTNDAWSSVFAGASSASAFELHTLGRVLLFKGQAARAEFYVKRLNILLPSFVPGIDLWVKTMQKLRRMKELEDALLLRIRLAGADAGTRAALATLPTRNLSLDRRITFMAADPEGFGRREVARGFLSRGRPDLALELVLKRAEEPAAVGAVVAVDPNDLPEAREIAAAALLDLGRPQEAFQVLDSLGARATSTSEALDLYTRAALHSGHRKALEIATKRVSRWLVPRRGAWLRLSEVMLSHGAAEAALPLVRRLDSSPGTRGGEVLLALAWIQLHLGVRQALDLTLERADAFETEGEVEIVGLLAAAEGSDLSRTLAAISRLKSSGWKPNRLQRAALLLLEGEKEEARKLIDAGIAERSSDPSWVLADALERTSRDEPIVLPESFGGAGAEAETARFLSGEKRIDPRLVSCLLIVANDAAAAGWLEAKVRARMSADEDARDGLWERWLMARFSRTRGEIAIERLRLEALLAEHPGFEPAWDRLEEIAASSRMPGADLLSVRERRLHAQGLRAGTEAERVFTIARVQHRDGDLDGALASLARVAEIQPSLKGVSLEVGRIRAERGEWAEAVRAFVAASEEETRAADLESTGALIEALDRAGQMVPPALTVVERLAELEVLAKRVPDDSRVPVALARADLEQDPRNPAVVVARGQARLQKFLGAHKDTNIEDLGTGAAAAWTDYLLELDPDRARRMLERDRERDPSGLEPWIQLGRIRAAKPVAQGKARKDDEKEMDELETVRRMAPIAQVMDAYARVRLAGSPRLQEIMRIARDVPASLGRTEPDPELAVQLSRAYFGLGPNGLTPALKLLNQLSRAKDVPPDLALEAELLRAEVVVTRGDTKRAARILGDISSRITDPYRATVAQTVASLADRVSQQ